MLFIQSFRGASFIKYKDREHIAKIKGVDNNFKLVNNIDTMIKVNTLTLA